MQFLYKCAVTVTVISFAMAALSIGTSAQPARGPAGPGVTVINTPLPIAGDVNATVTGSVSLTGNPTVTVGNPESAPALVRDVDYAARERFELVSDEMSYCCTIAATETLGFVPAGKRLIIEHVSAFAHLPPGQRWNTFTHVNDDFVPFVFQGRLSNGLDHFVANYQTSVSVEPGNRIVMNLHRDSTEGRAFVWVRIFGYLVPVP